MNFMSALKDEANSGDLNVSVTENGAIGYRTTNHALLDMNFAITSLRGKSDLEIERMFSDACAEDLDLAIVWMFFARDCRGGAGERRLFRVCFRYLAREFPAKAVKLVSLIAEYGRWDDVIDLFFTVGEESVKQALLTRIADQLNADLVAMRDGKSASCISKWMPSENTSSQESRHRARKLALMLGVTPRRYRRNLASLRRHIDVVERKMSAGKWDEIDYERVPSKANLLYRDAFSRHDPDRRNAFLASLKQDPTKIKASVLFPHEIVSSYKIGRWSTPRVDETLEALWKNLPNVFPGEAPNILVVADGSGSMCLHVDNSGTAALDVANALAIYFAEKLPGPYRDKYITFSDRPQYVNLSGSTTLLGKIETALEHSEIANTNIERVFDLILRTAVHNHLRQDELPDAVLILSDMEFDQARKGGYDEPFAPLFQTIADKYAAAGYKLPRLAFWNLGSRTGTIPVTENEAGVALVSGFSPTIVKMVMSGRLDPFAAMVDVLNDKRYDAVREALA